MKILKIIVAFFAINSFIYPVNVYAESFVVEDIQLRGQRHVDLATVLSYLPIKKGENINEKRVRNALAALYRTGLFEDIEFLREKNILIVKVDERPAIAEINIDGNNKLEDDMLKSAFDSAGLVVGRIYNANVLDSMRKELETVYYSLGRYGIKMNSKVTELPRDRVKIDINIEEGRQAKIKHINIVGNTVFSDEKILDDLKSGIPSWWAIFSSKDKYEKNKLNADLEAINSFYFDRGYLDFKVESTQVSISDDKKDIYISINVTEGEQYTISNLQYTGELILPTENYDNLIKANLSVGDIFSRKKVNKVITNIQNQLGVVGHLYADVAPVTNIDEESKQVGIVFNVDAKQKVYVNSIVIRGNNKTVDEVYRRELRQMESAVYNSQSVERSRVRIQRLEYVENVQVKREPVANKSDSIDLVYEVKERLAGSFTAGIGLSDAGTSFNLGITQSNVFGTGNALSLNLSNSDTTKNYSISYRNPYYKTDNLSRSIRFSFREFDATDEDISAEFLLDTFELGVTYGLPLSEYGRLSYGYSIGSNEVLPINLFDDPSDTSSDLVSPVEQIRNFIDENGTSNDYLRFNFAYVHDRRDRRIFATKGSLNRFTYDLTAPASDITYYELSYTGQKYFKTESGSLLLETNLRFGEGLGDSNSLPFYEQYLAGGVRSLRGFDSRSIGPLEIRDDGITPDPIGGNLSTLGTVEWLFNLPGNSSQFSLFYDFGSVFENSSDFDASEFRSSYGLTYNWLSPVGPLVFSYGIPIEKEATDSTQRFQFTIGTSF